MRITVELRDSEMKAICRLTAEKKKGPAVRKLVADFLRLKRRQSIVQKFLSGEWGVELTGYEAQS